MSGVAGSSGPGPDGPQTPFVRVGGEATIRPIVDHFVDRVFADRIVGFFFDGKDRDRVKQHEYEHAAAVLGAGIVYQGRPIRALHKAMPINAGHFRRRLALLKQEIERAGLPDDVAELWLEGQRRMERQITDGTDCAAPGRNDAAGR